MTPDLDVALRLTVTGLTKAFAGGPVLRDVELVARGGSVVTVTGPPGSGTTTLARCLTGTYRPDAGSVAIGADTPPASANGHGEPVDLATADARTVAWARRHHVAALDGPLAVPPRRPAASAVARLTGLDESAATVVLDRAGAAHLAATPVGRLRGEERRRVALAAALGGTAPIVVLDDPGTEAATGQWIAEVAATGRVVVVTATEDRSPPIPRTAAVPVLAGRIENGAVRWQEP
ncbi:MAG: ATP-binding cassette domain-containing protein [Actinomycetota bacterium]|nr:ATP-binding cassette domain-containing protein [Actinomycetota bacterium]